MKFLPFLLIMLFTSSCQNQADKNIIVKDSTTIKEIPTDTSNGIINKSAGEALNPPSIEDAETLVARYYSTRNQELKYPFYKGLGLKILDIKRIDESDSFLVFTHVTGRKWPNPNKDTLTFPFEENNRIRAFKNGALWQADSVGKK
jgi:hypothetical protein